MQSISSTMGSSDLFRSLSLLCFSCFREYTLLVPVRSDKKKTSVLVMEAEASLVPSELCCGFLRGSFLACFSKDMTSSIQGQNPSQNPRKTKHQLQNKSQQKGDLDRSDHNVIALICLVKTFNSGFPVFWLRIFLALLSVSKDFEDSTEKPSLLSGPWPCSVRKNFVEASKCIENKGKQAIALNGKKRSKEISDREARRGKSGKVGGRG